MTAENSYRALTQDEIKTLESQGCSAGDWNLVRVANGFDPARVKNAHFSGQSPLAASKRKFRFLVGLKETQGFITPLSTIAK